MRVIGMKAERERERVDHGEGFGFYYTKWGITGGF